MAHTAQRPVSHTSQAQKLARNQRTPDLLNALAWYLLFISIIFRHIFQFEGRYVFLIKKCTNAQQRVTLFDDRNPRPQLT